MNNENRIHDILKKLPHRYPFILVDRVVSVEPGKRLLALKNVTINEPFFMGHFPSHPVMPGVLILEALAQASALLVYNSFDIKADDKSIHVFAGIDNARFKKIVEPGDQLFLDVRLLRVKQKLWKLETQALVDNQVVCTAELMSAIKELERD